MLGDFGRHRFSATGQGEFVPGTKSLRQAFDSRIAEALPGRRSTGKAAIRMGQGIRSTSSQLFL
jgi:hypothetical protein